MRSDESIGDKEHTAQAGRAAWALARAATPRIASMEVFILTDCRFVCLDDSECVSLCVCSDSICKGSGTVYSDGQDNRFVEEGAGAGLEASQYLYLDGASQDFYDAPT